MKPEVPSRNKPGDGNHCGDHEVRPNGQQGPEFLWGFLLSQLYEPHYDAEESGK